MIRRPPSATRPDTLVPDTPSVRSRERRGLEPLSAGAARGIPFTTAPLPPAGEGGAQRRVRAGFSREAVPLPSSRRRDRTSIDVSAAQNPLRARPHVGDRAPHRRLPARQRVPRSEEHTSELQSLMRISYAVFCLKKKKTKH